MNTWTGWDDDDEFAKRIRRELADAAGQVEPRRTLADLLVKRIRRPRSGGRAAAAASTRPPGQHPTRRPGARPA